MVGWCKNTGKGAKVSDSSSSSMSCKLVPQVITVVKLATWAESHKPNFGNLHNFYKIICK